MTGSLHRIVCLATCAVTLMMPRALAAQTKPAPAKPAQAAPAAKPPAPPAKAQPAVPAKPQPAAAPARLQPATPAKPQPATPAKPQAIAAAKPTAASPAKPQTPAPIAAAGAAASNSIAAKGDDDLAPAGYTYDPQGRRDPFISLLQRGGISGQRGGLGVRPPGLGGLDTGEVTLKGTLLSQGAYVGIVQGSDNKTYIVKSGDKLADGEIRSITPDTMVIMQQVTDPLSLEKQREVRKLLRPTTEEAK